MEPHPCSPASPLSPSVRVGRQLFYDRSPSPTRLAAPTVVTIAQAPPPADCRRDTSYLVCAEEFFEDNPLIAATLQPRTRHVYAIALENFRASSFASRSYELPIDHRICLYMQDCFARNPKPGKRQEMANLLSILLIMIPSLRGSHLGLSRRCLTGWRMLRPSKSSAPFTKDIVLALAWHLVIKSKPEAACVLLTSFSACLRVSEALSLRMQDIALPGDMRIASHGSHVAGINVRDAKTARYSGTLQFVKIDDVDAIKFLQAWKASTSQSNGALVCLSYHTYAADLNNALAAFGLHNAPFTSHSARIGKATQDYVAGVPVDQIAVNGRWKSLNSLRYYVTNGRAWLLDTNISPNTQHRLNDAARHMKQLIQSNPRPTRFNLIH